MTSVNLGEVAEWVKGRVVGDADVSVTGFAGAQDAGPGDLTFAADSRWLDAARTSAAAAVLVKAPIDDARPAQIVVDDPNLAFAIIVERLTRGAEFEPGVHPRACVEQDADVDPTARIGAGAVVESGAFVGARTIIGSGAVVGARARVGEDCRIKANVTLLEGVVLGDRVTIHSGTVIGSDGYGYATSEDGIHVKVPQTGSVVIEDDVEIGANVCVDRARMAETRIGQGTKIDNLVQLGHNVKIGPHCLIVSQSGVAGSTELGHHVVLGGNVGVTGHVKIGDGAQVTAMSGVSKDLPGGAAYMGVPAVPISQGKRIRLFQMRLPDLVTRLKALEKKAAETHDG